MSEIQVRLNLEAPQLFKTKVGQVVKEVFQLDILPEAIKNSPVTPEGLAYNLAKAKGRPSLLKRAKGTGHNRQSLDVEFTETPSGPEAKLFGQSGYSGYLEVGTSKMRAQPYIWPAWLKFKDKITALIRSR